MIRTWTSVGADAVDRIGRPELEAEIERFDWQEIPKGGALTVGFMPGHSINAAISELRLPKVSHVAISAFSCPPANGDGDGYHPGFYGIECHYSNGRARVYLVDEGSRILPVASDFWEATATESGAADEARPPSESSEGARCESGVGGERPRLTTRERRLRRAERLRGWAEKREARADAAHARVHEIGDLIPFGQPVLVGHHSEGRHRRDLARIDRGMRESIDSSRMAASMSSRADTIEAQADRAIYRDDDDEVERLEERIAELEAKRSTMKTANAAYRKEHRAELAAMGPYDRGQAVPYPSYSLSNLTGNLRRYRNRLEEAKRRAAALAGEGDRGFGRTMIARYGGDCPDCDKPVEKGDPIVYYRLTREAVHAACAER